MGSVEVHRDEHASEAELDLDVLLISTYEMGRQPFGLASPAAWLRAAGARVRCLDLSIEQVSEAAVREAGLMAMHVPMHMATRMAVAAVERLRALNPDAHLCFYGLYASGNEAYLRGIGADSVLGGEFETGLVELARRVAAGRDEPRSAQAGEPVSLARQDFLVPDRSGLPELPQYAHLIAEGGEQVTTGYVEASRGCKHLCRHCPIVPVYNGRFRIVGADVVLADVDQQVRAGARHITFGDPDFFNGPTHGMRIVRALHEAHPGVTYDVTIKVEHLVKHLDLLETLAETGCGFVTTAVESFDDEVLERFDKRHSMADLELALERSRTVGLDIVPTFVAFTPWTTLDGYRGFLREIVRLDLVDSVAPIQYTIRLLIPPGSKLLELEEVRELAGPLAEERLYHPWEHLDPRMDVLQRDLEQIVAAVAQKLPRRETFARIWERAFDGAPADLPLLAERAKFIPYLTEPWYC